MSKTISDVNHATGTTSSSGTNKSPDQFHFTADSTQWIERLITKEDRFHIHKTLGLACLLSFFWRILQISETSDMGFARYPHLTIPTLCLHSALSVSSLEFKIPNQRIKEGSRIWPEYRLHSIVFALRSVVTIALYWYEQQYTIVHPHLVCGSTNTTTHYAINVVIVLGTMVAADLSTKSHQQHASSTIRNLDISRATSYFFSVCQFYATAGVLFGVRRCTIQFLNVFVVQLNPFLMTLRRKNLISHHATVTIYGAMLVFGVFTVGYEYARFGTAMLRTVAFVGNVAILWRMFPLRSIFPHSESLHFLQNKYLIWAVLGLAVNTFLRPLAYQELSRSRQLLYTTGMMAVVANGIVKCQSQCYSHGGAQSVEEAKTAVKKN